MPTITSNHKDLFRTPDTEDKLNLFRLLLNANELTVTLSLALLKIIHGELKSNEYSRPLCVQAICRVDRVPAVSHAGHAAIGGGNLEESAVKVHHPAGVVPMMMSPKASQA